MNPQGWCLDEGDSSTLVRDGAVGFVYPLSGLPACLMATAGFSSQKLPSLASVTCVSDGACAHQGCGWQIMCN